jgi:hypothetical protein
MLRNGTARHTTDDNKLLRKKDAICVPHNKEKLPDNHSNYLILIAFHCNNCYANAPQYYIIRTLPALSLMIVLNGGWLLQKHSAFILNIVGNPKGSSSF